MSWRRDTIAPTCKTFATGAALVLAGRGEVDLEAPWPYWPEFGKDEITVRTLLPMILKKN
ncbi:hypothetical protein [Nonomuraea angiospora]|uniref:hypothetical protein n=1 Tax=Nonomuraea angiospora TaxID=46172 RepID=UPI0029ABC573|nr:hypothetical protein [Nonomuraea angiospora]MDX3111231.1 serine hydrolase [Nonomuraea angiospora]